jgi:hypothetical protein
MEQSDDGSYAVEQYRSDAATEPVGGPYDSVILDRGDTGYPVPSPPVRGTRLEDLPVGQRTNANMHAGYEFIVYSWDQARVLREVPRDPVPEHLKEP